MHHTISYDLAQARAADLRRHAKRDTLARAARPARPGQRGHAAPGGAAPSRWVRRKPSPRTVPAIASLGSAVEFDQLDTAREAGRAAARQALDRAPAGLVA